MGVNFKEMSDFLDGIEQLKADTPRISEELSKELASRFLAKVVKRTPVGRRPQDMTGKDKEHWTGYVGGTLRRGWTVTQGKSVSGTYKIDVINTVPYASYVEYGHRQQVGKFVPAIGARLKNGFVKGQFMMTQSASEIEQIAPALVSKKLQTELERYTRGK